MSYDAKQNMLNSLTNECEHLNDVCIENSQQMDLDQINQNLSK